MYVRPAFRRMQIGRQLTDSLIVAAKEAGHSSALRGSLQGRPLRHMRIVNRRLNGARTIVVSRIINVAEVCANEQSRLNPEQETRDAIPSLGPRKVDYTGVGHDERHPTRGQEAVK
jgi:hypothetical protein